MTPRQPRYPALLVLWLILPATLARAQDVVYLSDMTETEVSVGQGQVGKHGKLGYWWPMGHQMIHVDTINIKGLTPADIDHCIAAHGPSHLAYAMDPQYAELTGAVAVSHEPHTETSVLNFQIIGDGKVLWETGDVKHQWEPVPFRVDISNVNKLVLAVKCGAPPNNQGCDSVWIAPQVSGKLTKPPVLAATGAEGKVDLSWTDPGGGKGPMRIERSRDGLTDWKLLGNAPPKTAAYEDAGFYKNTTYYYRIDRDSDRRYSQIVPATTGADGGVDASYLAEMDAAKAPDNLVKGTKVFGKFAATSIQGMSFPHVLSVQPAKGTPRSVGYDLGGRYKIFVSTMAAEADAAGTNFKPVVFKVVGDGKILWTSRAMAASVNPQTCSVDISGVKRLELVAWSDGDAYHALWLEPQVAAAAPNVHAAKAAGAAR